MKKEGLILVLVIALIGLFIFVESTEVINVYNVIGFPNSTYPDAKIVGKINLSVSGIAKGINLSSNQEDSIDFYNFSEKEGYSINCFPEDCSNDYTLLNEGGISKISHLDNGDEVFLGLYIPTGSGEIESIESLNITLESDFDERNVCPLEINFFEGEFDWKFQEFSETSYASKDYGFYNATYKDDSPSRISNSGKYCTEFDFEDLRNLKVGADIVGSGSTYIKMELYDSYKNSISNCYYKPSNGETNCLMDIDTEDIESSINPYYVCVTSNTTTLYDLYEESTSTNKTGYFVNGQDNFYIDEDRMNKNYAIFIQKAKYADATKINNSYFSGETFENNALSYLYYKYDYNCSEGCIIPLKITSAATQGLKVQVNDFTFKDDNGIHSNQKVYIINQTKAKLILNDVIDLSKTGFKIQDEGDYILYLGDEEILNEEVEFLESYRITSMSPIQDIPSNALTDFFVFVDDESEDLTYYWNFSDNTTFESDTNHIQKIFETVGNYTVNLEVIDGDGIKGFNEFDLQVVAPTDEVVNKSYTSRRDALDNFKDSLDSFTKYKSNILTESNFSYYDEQLIRIKKDIEDDIKSNSEILNSLNKLKIPLRVVTSTYNVEFYPSEDDIKTSLVSEKADEEISSADSTKYKEQILDWEEGYIQGQIVSKEIKVEDIYGEEKTIITDYTINAYSDYSDGKSYLTINVPKSDISFNGSYTVNSVSNGTFVEFKNKLVNFYILETDSSNPIFFFTTDLENYNIGEISECNNNGVCEKSSGENSSNCRADCSPVSLIVIWLVLISVLGVIIFFGLKVWFKKNYEKKLFSNPRDLANLMKFVNNAKRSGLSKSETKKELLEAGWSIDRINYAIKKTFKEEPVKKETPVKETKKSRNINKSKKI